MSTKSLINNPWEFTTGAPDGAQCNPSCLLHKRSTIYDPAGEISQRKSTSSLCIYSSAKTPKARCYQNNPSLATSETSRITFWSYCRAQKQSLEVGSIGLLQLSINASQRVALPLLTKLLRGCLFINFKRLKSASMQGAAIFVHPSEVVAYPIHALVVDTIMESTPSEILMGQFSRETSVVLPEISKETPLRELIQRPASSTNAVNRLDESENGARVLKKRVLPGIRAYKEDGTVTKRLSSHFFTRGAAQNANGHSAISTPWILDWGEGGLVHRPKSWQRASRTGFKNEPQLPTLGVFDSVIPQRILFASCRGLRDELIFRNEVVVVRMAAAIMNFNVMCPCGSCVTIHRKGCPTVFFLYCCSMFNRDEIMQRQVELLDQRTQFITTLAAQVKSLNDRIIRLEDHTPAGPPGSGDKRVRVKFRSNASCLQVECESDIVLFKQPVYDSSYCCCHHGNG
ncbi:hypothetical protein P3T76_002406 [Phytophthora citrophthora]|uniref:Uncharacterized protein n=1 Tax=Phytophthora citrophthora TaxID=4793 RepID=A0AAD9LU69_9STRA|nr:hypothetical protein P3T76_002406 [Phytophthora citrophthora]